MKVYVMGLKAARQATYTVSIAPAATIRNGEIPQHWFDEKGAPLQMNIEFTNGEAEVEDGIGEYLIKQGLARRSRLALPRVDELSEAEQQALVQMGIGG